MIKEERFKSILGILLVPVLVLVIVGVCMGSAGGEVMQGRIVEAEGAGINKVSTLEERGYVQYQPMHPGIKALYEQKILESVWEKDNDNDQEPDEKDQEPDMEEENGQEDMSEMTFDQIETGDYLKRAPLVVQESQTTFECLLSGELSFDSRKGTFTSTDLISRIEAAGFEGFSKSLEKAAKIIQCCIKYDDDHRDEMVKPVYYFCCQGVEFSLVKQTDELFQLLLHFNFSSCYAPAKYQEFVKEVISGGKYFLSASTVGGEIETLTFSKNDTVSLLSDRQHEDLNKMVDGKRIVFMFRDGKLVDYYITVQGGDLALDDSDKNLIDKYANGIGKGYPDKVSMKFSGYGICNIYRP